MSQNLVAFCDVQDSPLAAAIKRFETRRLHRRSRAPAWRRIGACELAAIEGAAGRNTCRPAIRRARERQALRRSEPAEDRKYRDYREMLERANADIDAMVIATPTTCTPSPIATMAMDLGKHVYVQKPLASSSRSAGRAKGQGPQDREQMGTRATRRRRPHRYELHRERARLVKIRRGDVWTNRPLGIGRRACRGRRRRRDPKRPLGWNGGAVDKRLAAALAGDYPKPAVLRLEPVPRRGSRKSSTTPSTIRSTGAAGWTGARARSATWARISSITRSGR